MFHPLSLAISWLVVPSSWFLLLQLWALWSLWRGRIRRARWLFTATVLAALTVRLPIPALLIQPLESFATSALPPSVDGIIVLAGAERVRLSEALGAPQFSEDSERATEFIALARKYPKARYVFTGQEPECEVFRMFLRSQGFDPERVIFEADSRDTYESAVNTYRVLRPQPQQAWVLLTSAVHMRRAYGAFHKIGWNMTAYPVAYRALPHVVWGPWAPDTLEIAVHEWLGILAYKIAGRI